MVMVWDPKRQRQSFKVITGVDADVDAVAETPQPSGPQRSHMFSFKGDMQADIDVDDEAYNESDIGAYVTGCQHDGVSTPVDAEDVIARFTGADLSDVNDDVEREEYHGVRDDVDGGTTTSAAADLDVTESASKECDAGFEPMYDYAAESGPDGKLVLSATLRRGLDENSIVDQPPLQLQPIDPRFETLRRPREDDLDFIVTAHNFVAQGTQSGGKWGTKKKKNKRTLAAAIGSPARGVVAHDASAQEV